MALAIDTSTPAFVSTAGTSLSSLTTASFTPPSGALLVVALSRGAGAVAMPQPSNTGGTVSWEATAAVSEAASFCAAGIWRGVVTSSASMTVNVTWGGGVSDWGFGVFVLTGQAATQNGATQVATSSSGTASATIASLVGANSLVLGVVSNFTNKTVGTPGTNQVIPSSTQGFANTWSYSDTGGIAGWVQYDTRMNLASGASDTINDTAPTGIDYSMAVLEILAGSGGGGAAPFTPVPQLMMMGVGQRTNFERARLGDLWLPERLVP